LNTTINKIKPDLNLSPEKNFEKSTPVIFNKKLNKSSIKELEFISSDTGIARHYTPAAQEWYNSVYAYNNNYIKGLPVLDKSLMKLLKGYFNMYIGNKKSKTISIDKINKRRSPKKIFIGKGELKHTSTKVIITFYVYNTEKFSLRKEFRDLYNIIYSPKIKCVKMINGKRTVTYLKKTLEKQITLDNNGNIAKDIKGNEMVTYNRPYTIEEFLNSPENCRTKVNGYGNVMPSSDIPQTTYYDVYCSIISLFMDKVTTYLEALTKYYDYLTNLVKLKVLNDHEKFLIFTNKASSFYAYNYPNYDSYKDLAEEKYKENLYRLRYLLKFNSVKFEKPFITKLTHLVEKLYNKNVEFNIVNLKKVHLNSDILTQAIVLKLKNKKNRLARVLKLSLSKAKLPNVNRLGEKYQWFNKDDFLVNKIRNTYVNNMFNNNITKIDPLNKLLLNLFPSGNNLEIDVQKSDVKHTISLKNYVLRELKHLKLAGVRLEAKGRLSRRFTAARSLFKLTWKGGLKNVDSSFKGLSTVMLRGNVKSNVEYSMLKSKTRIGAFGIKGWVGSK
jgi:hypothetical protein